MSVIAVQTHHAEASAIPLLGMRFALQDVASLLVRRAKNDPEA